MNEFSQSTQQTLTQTQTLTPQQLMVARLIECPLEALRERIDKECIENQYLERNGESQEGDSYGDSAADNGTEDFNTAEVSDHQEQDNYESEELPTYVPHGSSEQREREQGQEDSFYDKLKEQMGEYDMDEHMQELVTFLIGSLDNDGLLRTPLYQLADELDIYHGIPTTEREMEQALHVLQQFDPAGIGARTLQECFLLQANRITNKEMRQQLSILLRHYYDEFTRLRWDRIQQRMKLTDLELDHLRHYIQRHLNPRPGGSLGYIDPSDNRTITPDFLVDVSDDGHISVTLNEGGLPTLVISPDAQELLGHKAVTRSELEGQRFVRNYVERGQMFIDALVTRRQTMLKTIQSIVRLQHDFFRDGDESALHPMKLEDVAQQTGLDISTISRVSNSKFVQTPYGTYPLRWFFTSGMQKDGQEVSIRQIMNAMRQIINAEDKRHPINDDAMARLLQQRGYQVARRTIAKYREQMGIPVARMRKE